MRKAFPLLLAFSAVFQIGFMVSARSQAIVGKVPAGAVVCGTYKCTVGGQRGTCTRFCGGGTTCGPNNKCLANLPAVAPIKVKHTADCPTVEKLIPRGKGHFKYNVPQRVFSRDCVVTRPNGQVVRRKQGEPQSPMDRLRGKWKGSKEAGDDGVVFGGKG